jgi:hypothetical protein
VPLNENAVICAIPKVGFTDIELITGDRFACAGGVGVVGVVGVVLLSPLPPPHADKVMNATIATI